MSGIVVRVLSYASSGVFILDDRKENKKRKEEERKEGREGEKKREREEEKKEKTNGINTAGFR